MRKKDELADPNSCINRSKDDEPVFVLCGRDRLAPAAVRSWADAAVAAGTPRAKVHDAYALAQAMEEWQLTNGSKIPD